MGVERKKWSDCESGGSHSDIMERFIVGNWVHIIRGGEKVKSYWGFSNLFKSGSLLHYVVGQLKRRKQQESGEDGRLFVGMRWSRDDRKSNVGDASECVGVSRGRLQHTPKLFNDFIMGWWFLWMKEKNNFVFFDCFVMLFKQYTIVLYWSDTFIKCYSEISQLFLTICMYNLNIYNLSLNILYFFWGREICCIVSCKECKECYLHSM